MKLDLVFIFVLLALLCAGFVRAESFLVWNKSYYGYANCVVPSGDGGFLISGYTHTPGVTSADSYLVKIDGDGNKVWEQTYGRKGFDLRVIGSSDLAFSKALVQSGDGGFVVCGKANCAVSSADLEAVCDIYIWKVDANGDRVWEKIYEDSFAWCITQSGDGGFVVGGGLIGGELTTVLYIMKIDSEGNKIWEKTYPSGQSGAYDITESGDGGYVLVGSGNSNGNIFVLKIDSEGNKVWGKNYSGPYTQYGKAITRSNEGFIIAGYKNNVNGSLDALYLLGLDQDGDMTWEKTFIDEHSYRANDIIPVGDGFVVAGSYWGRMYFLKIDSHGDKIWETTIPYIRQVTSITEAGDGGFIFTANSDFFVAKIKGTPIPIPEIPIVPLLLIPTYIILKKYISTGYHLVCFSFLDCLIKAS